MREVSTIDRGSLKGILESLLLVSTDAVSARELAQAAQADEQQTESALRELSADYADANRGIQLREVAGGWRLFTHPAYHDQVQAYVLSWDKRRLSQAALETLAELQKATKELALPEPEIVQIQVSRIKKAGSSHLMQAQNPVYIVTFDPSAIQDKENLS